MYFGLNRIEVPEFMALLNQRSCFFSDANRCLRPYNRALGLQDTFYLNFVSLITTQKMFDPTY